MCFLSTACVYATKEYCSYIAVEVCPVISKNATALSATIAGLSGTMLGFILAAITILLAVIPTRRFQVISKSSHIDDLWEVHFSGVLWCGVCCLSSTAYIALEGTRNKIESALPYLILLSSSIALTRIFHCVRFLKLIVKVQRNTSPPPE